MHVAFYTFANKDTGYGHFFRCLALAEEAWYRGHSVTFISDRNPGLRYVRFIKAPYLNTVTVFQVNEVTPGKQLLN